MRSKRIIGCLLTLVLIFSTTGNVFAVGIDKVNVNKEAKNVILLIPDGMSTDGLTLARWYNGNRLQVF